MQIKDDRQNADVGIIIGRFQCPEIHDAHRELIQHVADKHDKVIIFLGLAPVFSTSNPLDYETRKRMLATEFPDVEIAYVHDSKSDELWSRKLDEQIGHLLNPRQTAVLYGSRDSFLSHYSGKYRTIELEQTRWVSATEMRRAVKNKVGKDRAFRHGAIWASWQKFPTVFTTVDAAIVDETRNRLLLGKKLEDEGWRFVGGFSDPADESFEHTVSREVREETGLAIDKIKPSDYIGSFNIDDWRYRGTEDSIRTLFYYVRYTFGAPIASDDIAEVQWFDIDKLHTIQVAFEHQVLMKAFMEYFVDKAKNEKETK